jgi:hypothetical protein
MRQPQKTKTAAIAAGTIVTPTGVNPEAGAEVRILGEKASLV